MKMPDDEKRTDSRELMPKVITGLTVTVLIISTPLLLSSTGAFIPALIAVGLLVIRTALEDRTLRAELTGYAEYATRVRFRLIPGVW